MRYRLVFVLVLCFAGCESPAELGRPAPDFSATTLDGQTVSLASLRGKVVVIDFWATWCGPCRRALPELREFVSHFEGKPVVLIGISADHNETALHDFLAVNPLPWPIVFDGDGGPIATRYNVNAYPTVFVIDQNGMIRNRDLHGAKLIEVTEKLLAKAK
ncbi:MAG: TlpA family protein disulfide reductase [Gemmataceae bacterium]